MVCVLTAVEDADPKFKLHAITGPSRRQKEAAVRVTDKKKKKLTLKGYSKVSLRPSIVYLPVVLIFLQGLVE